MKYLFILFYTSLLLVTGCDSASKQDDAKQKNTESSQDSGTIDSDLQVNKENISDREKIAKVGSWYITQQQLDFMTDRTLGSATLAIMYDQVGEQLLKSLIVSKAMAQQALVDLSDVEKEELDLQVNAYREEILVRKYLESNANVQPVSEKMVRDYYQQHSEKFGGLTLKKYQIIKTVNLPSDKLLLASELFSKIQANSNWQEAVLELKQNNIMALTESLTSNPLLLSNELRILLENTGVGELSPATIINGNLYRVAVVEDVKTPVKSLQEVASDIRKMLAPLQLKKAVKAASDEVLEKVVVEYY
ncbi:hypothetical protein [Zooshikella harenae]|uniref:Peptidyl-prolyl cis-trans isomerase n=1 Tax=Zooshikella harenae TaxID=2827238 RepID=A0ABS5ZEY8_9GAMM|nr:hypothetical protein [Zooshikella harenae]MBU2712629.1 hypothetical protein [Zooshikella harenae]